jgi:CP family cyanate transporter-like MFS transporter
MPPTHDRLPGDSSAIMTPGLLVAALFLAALSLRPQLVGAGPLVPGIQADLGLSHAVAGLLGTIPVACMGVFAGVAPIVVARLGSMVAIGASVALIGIAGLARSLAADSPQIVATTIGIGIGMGIAGALLPVFVKQRLGQRPILGTVAYSAGLQLGSAASAALAVPLALAFGGWRAAFAVFSIATLALVVPWLLLGRDRSGETQARVAIDRQDVLDQRAWVLATVFALFGVVYYGLVAWLADAYVELGWSPTEAGGLLGLLNVASLTGALSIGLFAGRMVSHTTTLAVLGAIFAVATTGFAVLPAAGPAFAILAGYANGALFPLVLALPLRLVGSADRVAWLTSVMLGLGYTIAAISPVGLGAIRDVVGSFHASLLVLAVASVVFAVGVTIVGRWPTSENPA